MTTLETISGIKARIFTLDGRPPFMLAADLAEAYGSTVRAINQAVKRNPERFPDRYAFRLTRAEEEQRWSQNVIPSPGKRTDLEPLVFTHGGANMLSGVLKSPVADEMAVAINDAFTEMEQAAIRDARAMVARLQVDALRKKPIYGYIRLSMLAGQSLDEMWRRSSYPKWKLEQAAREMVAMRLADRLPHGMSGDLFGGAGDV